MKTIGVLGGLGPQATMDFETRVHRVAQRLIPPRANSGYPPMVVYYHRRPPFVMSNDATSADAASTGTASDDTTPVFPLQPDPDLLAAARWLGAKADFIVITANGPHALQAEIEQAAGCKVMSMIELTLQEVQQRGWRKVGVLVFRDPAARVYTEPLRQLDLAYETIEDDVRIPLDDAIVALMEGRASTQSTAAAREGVAALRAKNVDGIILGCTEIPLLLHEDAEEPDLVNPAQLLAEAAVKFALS